MSEARRVETADRWIIAWPSLQMGLAHSRWSKRPSLFFAPSFAIFVMADWSIRCWAFPLRWMSATRRGGHPWSISQEGILAVVGLSLNCFHWIMKQNEENYLLAIFVYCRLFKDSAIRRDGHPASISRDYNLAVLILSFTSELLSLELLNRVKRNICSPRMSIVDWLIKCWVLFVQSMVAGQRVCHLWSVSRDCNLAELGLSLNSPKFILLEINSKTKETDGIKLRQSVGPFAFA